MFGFFDVLVFLMFWFSLGGGGCRLEYMVLLTLIFFSRFSTNYMAKMHFFIENCPMYILYLLSTMFIEIFSEIVKDLPIAAMLVTDAVYIKFSLYLKIVMCILEYRLELKLMT